MKEEMKTELRKGSTRLTIERPDIAEPYYRGTRFDRSGIISGLEYGGHRFVSQWFRKYDPWMHDAVGGPAEEFTPQGYERSAAGKPFLKIGVGLLSSRDEEYDRFKLYDVIDPGRRTFRQEEDKAVFGHIIEGESYGYDYCKCVSIPKDGSLLLEHSLKNTGREIIDVYVYNHNFFVLDKAPTGCGTVFMLPFKPAGHWRSDYDCVALTEDGIRFSRDLAESESVFMGDLNAGRTVDGWSFILKNRKLSVSASSDAKMEYAVFWCNRDVACLEPYTRIRLNPGEEQSWKISYVFGYQE